MGHEFWDGFCGGTFFGAMVAAWVGFLASRRPAGVRGESVVLKPGERGRAAPGRERHLRGRGETLEGSGWPHHPRSDTPPPKFPPGRG